MNDNGSEGPFYNFFGLLIPCVPENLYPQTAHCLILVFDLNMCYLMFRYVQFLLVKSQFSRKIVQYLNTQKSNQSCEEMNSAIVWMNVKRSN